MERHLWEILVPTTSNEGKPFRTRFHRVWDAKIREISGGLTVLTPVKGQWVDPNGGLFMERMIPVRIIASRSEMDLIVKMTLEYYNQKAVLAYRLSKEVIMYQPQEGTDMEKHDDFTLMNKSDLPGKRSHYILLAFNDGSKYLLPKEVVAHDRAMYYQSREGSEVYATEYEFTYNDYLETLDWLRNNMNWEDFSDHLIKISNPSVMSPQSMYESELLEVHDFGNIIEQE